MASTKRTSEKQELRISFSPFEPKLRTQLKRQKLRFDIDVIRPIEQDVAAYVRLNLRYRLPAKVSATLKKAIWTKVARHVAEMN